MSDIQIALLITVIIVPLVFMTVLMSVNAKNYIWYRPTYEAIKSGRYVLVSKSSIYTYRDLTNNNNNEILLFIGRHGTPETIKLLGHNSYIHKEGRLDFYSAYWYYKILKEMRKKGFEINQSLVFGGGEVKSRDISSFKFFRG